LSLHYALPIYWSIIKLNKRIDNWLFMILCFIVNVSLFKFLIKDYLNLILRWGSSLFLLLVNFLSGITNRSHQLTRIFTIILIGFNCPICCGQHLVSRLSILLI